MVKFFKLLDSLATDINKDGEVNRIALVVSETILGVLLAISVLVTYAIGKFFIFIDNIVAFINKNIAVLGITLGVLLAFINVVLRYSFNASLTWAGELTNYLFIWSALFGAAYGFKKGIHISVTIVLHALPTLLAKWVLVFAHFISFVYLCASAYFGYELVLLMADLEEMSVDLNIPMWIPQLVLPLSFGAAAFRSLEKVWEFARTDARKVLLQSEAELVHDSVIKE